MSRPSRWGNRWCVLPVPRTAWDHETPYSVTDERGNSLGTFLNLERARYWAAIGFRRDFVEDTSPLRGHDLACWCKLCDLHKDGLPLGVECPDCPPCHGTVLLELANR